MSAQCFRYLQQCIILTCLGSATFTSTLDAAGEIYGHFDHEFSEGILDSWTSSQEKYHDAPCFNISNQYLTPAKDTMGLQDMPFHKEVDPCGILHEMANGNSTCSYVHTKDNQVQYFTTYRDRNSNRKSVDHFFKIDVLNSLLHTNG